MPVGDESPQDALLKALQAFIRQEQGVLKEPEPPPPTRAQAVFASLLAVNLALFLALVPRAVREHHAVGLALTLTPVIVGSGLVLYLEEFREWLLEAAKGAIFRRWMISLLVPLGGIHLVLAVTDVRLFALPVRPEPRNAMVSLVDHHAVPESEGDGLVFTRLRLDTTRVAVLHQVGSEWRGDTLLFSRRDVLGLTLCRFFGRDCAATVSARYPVRIQRGAGGGMLRVGGAFAPWFLRNAGRAYNNRETFVVRRDRRRNYIEFPLRDADHETSDLVFLPPGHYRFVLVSGNCCQPAEQLVTSSDTTPRISLRGISCAERCTPLPD